MDGIWPRCQGVVSPLPWGSSTLAKDNYKEVVVEWSCVFFCSWGLSRPRRPISKESAFCANPDIGTRDPCDNNSGLCAVSAEPHDPYSGASVPHSYDFKSKYV